MQYHPHILSLAETDELLARIEAGFVQNGFGLWAVEVPDVAPFIGFVGLAVPRFEAHFTPCVEIGWRLAAAYWNRGYASEAARAVLTFGFETVGLDQIVSFTVPEKSSLTQGDGKIGMNHNESDDFDHPMLPAGHPLKRHVLYRIEQPELFSK